MQIHRRDEFGPFACIPSDALAPVRDSSKIEWNSEVYGWVMVAGETHRSLSEPPELAYPSLSS
ncbi:hypothetical protein RUM44_008535 [Polyplax serrata]|uniref:Uncharacterized protein n=1 Tax=Polyplax serrata TaxID=468196 RepID=A0ABR1BD02_POLSC